MSDPYTYHKAGLEAELGGTPQFRGKQGHSCCGCCCDTRRAVIICNLVMIVLQVLTGTFFVAGVELFEAAAKTADDDAVINAGKQLQQIPMGLVVALIILQIVLHSIGVQGAIAYKKWMVYCALASFAMNVVVNIFQLNPVFVIFNVCLAYPHVFFIKEMNENIMTPENYPNEVQSCCCV
ncbi:hypothetical protein IV203_016164 [Nitzschia inconspicua]|uniref:Uncharacterized protein n=1 Tax=Nitzschia inconspicua TaxID=303405 RepID=A0A9K3PJR5_9STRA|nr:hypothetical protein IV203_016164 [Nitzschia inconspicua]